MIESEKVLEKYLVAEVKSLGGWAVKLLSGLVTGLPDRLILLPGGVVAFVEVKTTGKQPSPTQWVIHKQLRGLGFRVEVLDSKEGINNFINIYTDENISRVRRKPGRNKRVQSFRSRGLQL